MKWFVQIKNADFTRQEKKDAMVAEKQTEILYHVVNAIKEEL